MPAIRPQPTGGKEGDLAFTGSWEWKKENLASGELYRWGNNMRCFGRFWEDLSAIMMVGGDCSVAGFAGGVLHSWCRMAGMARMDRFFI